MKRMIEKVSRWTRNQKNKSVGYAGTHISADFWHGENIASSKRLEFLLIQSSKAAHSAPLKVVSHRFSPHGITGVVLLSESHISIHTWPEIGYTAVDIFTCGKKAKPREALKFLKNILKPRKIKITEMKRGKWEKEE